MHGNHKVLLIEQSFHVSIAYVQCKKIVLFITLVRLHRIMHRSNRNFNIPPPPRANPEHLTTSCARGVGNWTFTRVGWEKLNQKCQASSDFLFRAPKSPIAINTCLDEMEEFKGRDRTFVSDWLTKKGLQKL